ncbi:scyllo-inositol 2-dehydrogenase (NADP+) [Catalinimonas alkaloidigena]|uniref:Gfo/Idh/MocA family oxidoreductase n=1 Tax=Catalinimonas alkaloidigena TaxID=1075417 RepID=UPI0024056B4A|nr:Gfo/Idh/MocA family oxidoreductase [Catalinimonas alkaloidigena]MDF9797223.1 scyllo-inositol 2-dehydrogenase (NADP+) [Catalinimonas alkaloidigena]
MIRVALASYGMSGEVFHAPLLAVHPDFQLYKILERNRNKSQEKYPEVTVVKKYEDILQDEQVDVVLVNTPNPFHYEMAEKALNAGKHVVMEKPFTNTSEEAKKLIALANKKEKLLTVFQNRRLDSDFLTVKKVIESKLLGYLVEYEAHYDRYRNFIQANTWKEESGPGSGILFNLGSHMIDQALTLFGLPERLSAKLAIQREGGKTHDAYHLIFTYEKFQVVLKSSYLVRDEGPRYKVLGNLGTFTKYGLDTQEDCLKAGQLPQGDDWGAEPPEIWGMLETEIDGLHFRGEVASENGNYNLFYDNLSDAIQNGAELLVKPEEAMQVISLIELAEQSNKERREVEVKI